MTAETQLAGVFGGPGEVSLARLPKPVAGPRDIIVRILTCGICGSDLNYWRRGSLPPGSVPGHEFSGEVIEVGADVSGVSMGDYITADPMIHRFGLGDEPGAFAQYMRIREPRLGESVFSLPADLPGHLASLAEPLAVGLHGLAVGKAECGDRVVVLGAGTIGLCIVLALKAAGISNVTVRDPSSYRLRTAAALGAHAIDAKTPWDTGTDQSRMTTLIFDCAGASAALLEAQQNIAHGGRTVILASYGKPVEMDIHELMLRESAVLGAVGYGDSFQRAIRMVIERQASMELLISHHFPLDRLVEAFGVQGNPQTSLKVIIDVAGSNSHLGGEGSRRTTAV
jgi:2-desacetyl-2-hydroxyethyl bacteriochlorophyllide A dehydrogenase